MARLGAGPHSLELGWDGELPTPTLKGDTATYRDVLAGVDLVLTATRKGFAQKLVVRKRPTDAFVLAELGSIRLPVATAGATLSAEASGAMQVHDPKGELVTQAPAPTMWTPACTRSRGSRSGSRRSA